VSRPIRALIADDEPPARRRIRALAAEAGVEVAGECGDGVAALELVRRLDPDLVFLDVQMPELDGIAVAEELRRAPPGRPGTRGNQAIGRAFAGAPAVVFVTAYDVYAVRAFELHAIDYLLKPVDADRFALTLERVRRLEPDGWAERLDGFLADHAALRRRLERLVVREPGRVRIIRVEEIDWIEAAGNYVQVHAGRDAHLVHETLAAMAARLGARQFRRIHRSILVNVERVRQVELGRRGDGRVVLDGGARRPFSRTYRAELADLLGG
jgi:two-component system, LytTR family, response regulator